MNDAMRFTALFRSARGVALLLLAALGAPPLPAATGTPAAPAGQPADIGAQPVEETYFGTRVVDRFRFIESKDPATLGWMKAQSAWTRAVFDSIGPRAGYLSKLAALGSAFGPVNSVQLGGARIFYLERKPGSDAFDLIVRDGDGSKRTLIDTAALIKTAGGTPQAIDYFQTTRDGTRVAVGISAGGSENSQLSVLDAATGKTLAGPIDRAQFGSPAWLDDGSGLFFIRMQELKPGAKPTDKYLNSGSWFWSTAAPPVEVAGAASGHGPIKDPTRFPGINVLADSGKALLLEVNGVQNEVQAWSAPVAGARDGSADWRALVVTADEVTGFDANATTLWVLTHKDAPTFKVLSLPVDGTLKDARTVIAARPERVIESIHAASDALYVVAREGLAGKVLRVDAQGAVKELALPFEGTVREVATDPAQPGVVVGLDGWVHPPAHYRYDPAGGAFADLGLETRPPFDPAGFAAHEMSARAADGTQIPLSVITPAGPRRPRPMLLDAYGAYGISTLPFFSPRIVTLAGAGASYAECHVRGGGELGEAWRLGGKDANKSNTWRDFIACAEQLISDGYTTRALLTIQGTSAGGITVGRAATERPELFAAAVGRVGDLDALRSETMPSGPANIPEFGTVKDEQGFRNLYAMDAYQHVRNDAHYPAFLLTTGLNDPRVEPWEPAKMAARLLEVPRHAPVLLRVEDAAGHGLGTTKSTRDAEDADIAAFVFWRAGVPEWQPKK
ncbi:MAG TPA: prolyl oligopeptidase family serine peptidase [Steroidobacteraceae bacterium]|nr:prolyl oligopeptidase family serine peptidase [Steroidobacteraceae bacterium]